MKYTGLTPGAQRTVARCRRMASENSQTDQWSAFLVLTLLQDESLASACLKRLGITQQWLIDGELGSEVARSAALQAPADDAVYPGESCRPGLNAESSDAMNDPQEFTRVLDRAAEIARRGLNDSGVSSANLLLAIVETNDVIREKFAGIGATAQKIRSELYPEQATVDMPLKLDEVLVFSGRHDTSVAADAAGSDKSPAGVVSVRAKAIHASRDAKHDVRRVIDANLNRAREGLRVLEDFARFLADDDQISLELKSMRHDLVRAEQGLRKNLSAAGTNHELLPYRDTVSDVGTSHSTAGERTRVSLDDVVVANCRRVQESLRSLEEFSKLLSPDFSETVKQLRYRSYTVEKSLTNAQLMLSTDDRTGNLRARRVTRLQSALLYVLITESMCRLPWKQVVEQSLAAGADVLQLREKSLNDREILRRADWVRAACTDADALFIMNDRADLAVASGADGLHVGQDELTVGEARRILMPEQLVGVSTHSLHQAQQAVTDGADYLGVGPVFPSQTKSFKDFPGLMFVRDAAPLELPWFAIGGVSPVNICKLRDAGAARVAVTSAVAGSEQPGEVVSEMRAVLQLHRSRSSRV